MKVLLVTNMFPTADEPWYGSFVRDQVDDLTALGIEVEILTFDGRSSRREYCKAALAVQRRVRRSRFDLVHAHYGLSGAVALAQRRVPVITTLHGSDAGYIRWQRWTSRWVARHSTPVFVSRDGAVRLGLRSAAVVPMGVDTRVFAPCDRAEARRRLQWNRAGRYVLLPGARSNRVKGARLFDEAVARLREHVPTVRPVSLEGYPRTLVPAVLNAVDVVLMTSEFEGAPVTVKEALACMTPVVSVAVGDVPHVIAELPGCAVAERDPGGLARAVLAALSAPRDRRLRERAERFSRPLVAERVAGIYRDVVSGARR